MFKNKTKTDLHIPAQIYNIYIAQTLHFTLLEKKIIKKVKVMDKLNFVLYVVVLHCKIDKKPFNIIAVLNTKLNDSQ